MHDDLILLCSLEEFLAYLQKKQKQEVLSKSAKYRMM